MNIELLDVIELRRSLPSKGLSIGDRGTIVEIYSHNGIEVEFIDSDGMTKALVTLQIKDVQKATSDEGFDLFEKLLRKRYKVPVALDDKWLALQR